jgi:hypothetical protein
MSESVGSNIGIPKPKKRSIKDVNDFLEVNGKVTPDSLCDEDAKNRQPFFTPHILPFR